VENKNNKKIIPRSLAESTYYGLQFAVTVALFGYLGYYIDKKLDKEPLFLIVFVVLGFILGFINIIRKTK